MTYSTETIVPISSLSPALFFTRLSTLLRSPSPEKKIKQSSSTATETLEQGGSWFEEANDSNCAGIYCIVIGCFQFWVNNREESIYFKIRTTFRFKSNIWSRKQRSWEIGSDFLYKENMLQKQRQTEKLNESQSYLTSVAQNLYRLCVELLATYRKTAAENSSKVENTVRIYVFGWRFGKSGVYKRN